MNAPDHDVLTALQRWLEVRERIGDAVEPSRFAVEAEHSIRGGLLAYILAGNEPHEYPPPLAYSRPWHALIDEEGTDGPIEAWRLHEKWGADCGHPDSIVIAQHRWHLVEVLGTDDYLVEWRGTDLQSQSHHGIWRCTRTGLDARSGRPVWRLRPTTTKETSL